MHIPLQSHCCFLFKIFQQITGSSEYFVFDFWSLLVDADAFPKIIPAVCLEEVALSQARLRDETHG